MSNKRLVSFDLWANMAVFKKPDVNKDMYLTYNLLHKPMLLGILGAIAGLSGYKKNGDIPEYYKILGNIKIGIQPMQPDNPNFKGSYQKTAVTYNNSVGYASQEEGGNLIVTEQSLIEPHFRCYVLIDFSLDSSKNNNVFSHLYYNLKHGEADYVPYLGKNEFQASWMDQTGKVLFIEYEDAKEVAPDKDFRVCSIFTDDSNISPIMEDADDDDFTSPFFYFEHLPYTFHEHLLQYELKLFKYTNALLRYGKGNSEMKQLYNLSENKYVYLF